MGLRPLDCLNCGFESRRGHGSLSIMNVVCNQGEFSKSGLSLVQRSPTGCGVFERDHESSIMRTWPTSVVAPW